MRTYTRLHNSSLTMLMPIIANHSVKSNGSPVRRITHMAGRRKGRTNG